MKRTNRTILTFGALILGFCLTSLAEDRPLAPGWQLQNIEGKPIKFSDFKGKVVLLNFWATWCPPCRAEIPDLVSLEQQYSPRGLVVLGVALDRGGASVVKPFVKKMGINYTVVIGNRETADAYGGIEAVPTTFIIDRNGKVVSEQEGAADRATFEAAIKPLL